MPAQVLRVFRGGHSHQCGPVCKYRRDLVPLQDPCAVKCPSARRTSRKGDHSVLAQPWVVNLRQGAQAGDPAAQQRDQRAD